MGFYLNILFSKDSLYIHVISAALFRDKDGKKLYVFGSLQQALNGETSTCIQRNKQYLHGNQIRWFRGKHSRAFVHVSELSGSGWYRSNKGISHAGFYKI